MFSLSKLHQSLFLALLSAGLTACGDGSGSTETATFNLAITDGPVEMADAVRVTFTEVELKPAGGPAVSITLDEPLTLNLLDYQGSLSEPLVQNATLPAGEYNWVRLGVADNAEIEISGAIYPLEIPSSAQSGLKLNRGFTLAAGGVSSFTIDFDLRKSVHQEGTGDYKLRPTLRMVDNLEVGSISGSVAESWITDVECNNGDNNDTGNAVYLFAGADAEVADISGSTTDPIATASVSWNSSASAYEFGFGFVAAGDYTLAFTCDAVLDDPLVVDALAFSIPVNASVSADADTEVQIGVPVQ